MNLEHLDLSENEISQINLNSNKSLTHLNLSQNQISQMAIPEGSLLKVLDISQNRVTELHQISHLHNLIEFNLSQNDINSINLVIILLNT